MRPRTLVTTTVLLFGLAACGGSGQTTCKVTTQSGAAYTYDDGVAVTASPFTPFIRSGGKPGDKTVKTTVTLTNNGRKIIDLTLTTVHLRSGASGFEAEQVLDTSAGLTVFSGSLAPGTSASAVFGFAVDPGNTGPAELEISPGGSYASVMFEGTIA